MHTGTPKDAAEPDAHGYEDNFVSKIVGGFCVTDGFQATRECEQRQQLEDIFPVRVRPPLLYLDGIAIPH